MSSHRTRPYQIVRPKPKRAPHERSGMKMPKDNQLHRTPAGPFDVVTVADLPLTRFESSYDAIVRFVSKLPKGQGIRLKYRAPQPDAQGKASAIKAWALKIGKPVATQIRSAGGEQGDGCGYQVWVFKRTDFIVKRNGHATRL